MSRVDVILGGKNAGFKKMLTESRRDAKKFGGGMMKALNLGNAFGAANLGAMLLGNVKSLVSGIFGEFDRVSKISLRVDMDADQVRKYGVAADLSGASLAKLEKAWSTMVKAGVMAEDGLESYAKEFKRLGVDIGKFQSMDVEGKWLSVADAYSKSTDKAAAYAAVQVIMGGQSRDLIPLLSLGADGIRELTAELGDMDESDFKAIENLNDQLTVMSAKLKVAAGEGLPAVVGVFTTLWNVVSIVGRGIAGVVATIAVGLYDLFTGNWDGLADNVKNMWNSFAEAIDEDIDDIKNAWADTNKEVANHSDKLREAQRESGKLEAQSAKAAAKAEAARKKAAAADARGVAKAERAEEAAHTMRMKWAKRYAEEKRLEAAEVGDAGGVRQWTDRLKLIEKYNSLRNGMGLSRERALELAERELHLEERVAGVREGLAEDLEEAQAGAEAAESERDGLSGRADRLSGGVDSLQSIGLGAGGVRYGESKEVVKLRNLAVRQNELLVELNAEVAGLELKVEEAQF